MLQVINAFKSALHVKIDSNYLWKKLAQPFIIQKKPLEAIHDYSTITKLDTRLSDPWY